MEARRLHASKMSKLKLVGNHVTDDWAIAFKKRRQLDNLAFDDDFAQGLWL